MAVVEVLSRSWWLRSLGLHRMLPSPVGNCVDSLSYRPSNSELSSEHLLQYQDHPVGELLWIVVEYTRFPKFNRLGAILLHEVHKGLICRRIGSGVKGDAPS